MSFLILAFILLLVGSICDFRWCEVPDWLNYSFFVGGLGLSLLSTISEHSWTPLLMSITGTIFFGILGFGMFFSGQWGGGDLKTLIAVGSLLGAWFEHSNFGVSFLINIIPAATIYVGLWFVFLIWKHFHHIVSALKNRKMFMKNIPICITTIIGTIIISQFLSPFIETLVLLLGISIPVLFMLYHIIKVIEKVSFIKRVKPQQLVEGDWITTVTIQGKTIVKGGGIGVSTEEIEILKNLHKKGIINRVTVKSGLPFVPAFLLSFILTVVFGNVLFLLAKYYLVFVIV